MHSLKLSLAILFAAVLYQQLSSPLYGDQESSRIRFTSLGTVEGLPSNRIVDIEQDITGWVWLATDRGLAKFDGFKTIHFTSEPGTPNTLSSNKLTCIQHTDSEEKYLWIGTSDAGLNRLNLITEEIKIFEPSSSPTLLGKSILELAVTGNQFLWIGTNKGLNVMNLQTETIRAFEGDLSGARITCIRVISDDEIWVGTADGGLFHWSPEESDFSRKWTFSSPVTSIVKDGRNEIWIGTKGQGLFRYNPNDKSEPRRSSLIAKDVNSVFNDTNGDLWVGTTQGLARLERGSGLFTMFVNQPRDPNSLPDNQVNCVFEGRARMLWVATENGGVGRFSLDRYWFPHIKESSQESAGLPHPSLWGMATGKDGTIWMGTEKGLAEWIPEENFINQPLRGREFSDVYVSSVFEDSKGRLWIGTKGSGLILRNQEGEFTQYRNDPKNPPTIGHDYISAIYESPERGIFVGTWGAGVFQFDEASRQFRFANMMKGDSPRFVTEITSDESKHVWVGSREGLFVLRYAQNTIMPYRETFREAAEISSESITSVRPAGDGVLWVGTENSGLNRLRVPGGDVEVFNTMNSEIPDDSIQSLLIDQKGILWISTRIGLSSFHTGMNLIRNFGYEDGLQSGGFHTNSAAMGINGNLYFGGPDGFNVVDPETLPAIEQPPSPVLTGFEYFGERVKPGPGKVLEKPIASTRQIEIPFDKRNRIAFHFANLDYRFPGKGSFRYKLQNFEFDWNFANDSRRAAYPSLQPGNYIFVVESSPDGKNWSDNAAQVELVVKPQWWKTWWARISMMIIAIVGTVLTSRFFIRSRTDILQRREEKIRAQRDHAEAALARELQNTLLIERATRDFHSNRGHGDILNHSLHGLADRFGASHCLIHCMSDSEDEEGEVLELIGSYNVDGARSVDQFPIDMELPFIKHILQVEKVYSSVNSVQFPAELRENLNSVGAQSLLTIRTSFNGEPNGLISLLQADEGKEWNDEDFKLLYALSPQFGMAIAQIDLTRKEEDYREKLEEARQNAEVANRAKTDFLAKMTHELRTPLNAIIGFSEMIQEDETLPAKQRQLINIVNNSGEHLLDVINDILDVSKIEAGKAEKNIEAFELSPLLRTVYEMLKLQAKTKNIAFEIVAESSLPGIIETDRSKLRQSLINLLNNALKFTEKGSVVLSVKASALGPAESTEGRMARPVRVSFEVKDTGRGIAPQELASLFQSYSQTESGRRSSEGTGLGLTIARSFVQLMGGDIQVESTVGEGTTFRFYIECSEVAPSEHTLTANADLVSETNASHITGHTSTLDEVRILIAEDQPNNRLLLRKILEKAGFSVEEAHNGEDAVDRWRTWHPHLIFMDEDMPIMRGSEATRLIKAEIDNEDINPVIVSLTAYAMDHARELAMESGSQDFVAKPFKSHELYSVISKHLEVDYKFDGAA